MSTSQLSTQSAVARRSAEVQLRGLVATFAPAHQRLIGAMRRSLRKRLPTAHEVVYEYRDCFVVSYSPNEHGYEGILAIRGSADGVKLYFNRGKGLPDPEKLLRGSASQVRWILVEGASTIARPAVARLIDEAIARNRVPFARTGRGPVVIRSTSAKQRGRRRTATAVVLAVAGIFVTSVRANPGANDALKVEFIEVKGHECLQPVVSGAGAQLADYRAAEVRWLASKYPGIPTPESTTEIVLSPYSDDGDEAERTTVHRETFFLDGIVGEGAEVCFDINLEIDSAKPHE